MGTGSTGAPAGGAISGLGIVGALMIQTAIELDAEQRRRLREPTHRRIEGCIGDGRR